MSIAPQLIRAAWFNYLEACRKAIDYEVVEPYAWARLQEQLGAIERRQKGAKR